MNHEINACTGDCRLNTPPRCPCPDRCEAVTKIMQSQRRFLNHATRYVRPQEARGKTKNLAESIVGYDMPNEEGYIAPFRANGEQGRAAVVDSITGCKALCDFEGLDEKDVRAMIESYFSKSAFEILPGVWVA